MAVTTAWFYGIFRRYTSTTIHLYIYMHTHIHELHTAHTSLNSSLLLHTYNTQYNNICSCSLRCSLCLLAHRIVGFNLNCGAFVLICVLYICDYYFHSCLISRFEVKKKKIHHIFVWIFDQSTARENTQRQQLHHHQQQNNQKSIHSKINFLIWFFFLVCSFVFDINSVCRCQCVFLPFCVLFSSSICYTTNIFFMVSVVKLAREFDLFDEKKYWILNLCHFLFVFHVCVCLCVNVCV